MSVGDYMKDVIDYIKSLNINDYVIAGISSGPDSMCLLDLLEKANLKIVVAHVNHNVRKQSIEEEAYLRNYCLKNNVIFESYKIENYHNENFHKDARDIRYDFFRELLKKYNTKYLMTAHHGDDLTETILMRLVRGSIFKGYIGFSRITREDLYEKPYYIIRPLITKTKEEINDYLKKYNIKSYYDITNSSDEYTRNRYRNHILPLLKKENKNVHLKFLEFSEEIEKYYNYVEKCKNKVFSEVYNNNILDLAQYNKCDELIKERIVETILSNIYINDIIHINRKHKNMIINAINSKKPNLRLELPIGLHVIKSYDKLLFEFGNTSVDEYNYTLENSLNIMNNYYFTIVNSSDDTTNNCIRILSSDIKLPIHIRNKKIGDKMYVKNMNGSKKVSDIFIDLKVPKNIREFYPIVTDDNDNILWIPGLKKAKFDKKIDDLYDIIIKYEERKQNEIKEK